jgi:hypothetical protein
MATALYVPSERECEFFRACEASHHLFCPHQMITSLFLTSCDEENVNHEIVQIPEIGITAPWPSRPPMWG